ncbi:MAG TPA: carbamoyltransferase C-terminal domain-containing protein [Polyangium sp.]|nr:carbamoyltransferase C-terminal domain-containing protein [Polyangium sp.]
MTTTFGVHGPANPRMGRLAQRLMTWMLRSKARRKQFYDAASDYTRVTGEAMKEKLQRGEPVYLLGIGPGGHNSGIALVRVTRENGVEMILNNEEERFTAKKHCAAFPVQSIAALREEMPRLGIAPTDIHACAASFDYPTYFGYAVRSLFEGFPRTLGTLKPQKNADGSVDELMESMTRVMEFDAPRLLAEGLGLEKPLPIIGLRHHDNHAYFSYAASPFAQDGEPTMIAILDGMGDDGSISLYEAREGRVDLIFANDSIWDSLGALYSYISSTQGGWTLLSSEGRYMGAAAWGDNERFTNPYYKRLRQILYFGSNGDIRLNRVMANWHNELDVNPYAAELADILGPPIPKEKLWNPDAILNVDDVDHSEVTRERVDKAAALQLVFEDALAHVIENLIARTKGHRLVLAGGCALNCVANMRLLEHFDEAYYERYFGLKNTRLKLWVPPTPNDTGVTVGAAFHFALRHGGAKPGAPLRHAFYCGSAPKTSDIEQALANTAEIGHVRLGNINDSREREWIADLLAEVIANDGVMGVFQGRAETGPRALGHRSILANPCNPNSLARLNALVKHREKVRPLAPMATYEAAQRWFELSPGAADDEYNAYHYMVLTAPARAESLEVIPAVIHRDGTARVQIVREDTDPFIHAYLKAMGRRVGVEVSVNTSLNVGAPIAQTPSHALDTLKRSRGMTGILLIGDDGQVFVAWHQIIKAPKDGGAELQRLIQVKKGNDPT